VWGRSVVSGVLGGGGGGGGDESIEETSVAAGMDSLCVE